MIIVDHKDFEIFYQASEKLFVLRAYKSRGEGYCISSSESKQTKWYTDKAHCLWGVWTILQRNLSEKEYKKAKLEYSKSAIKSI